MLKFLNLIADKKFSLIELPVFLTIYMDTRYSNNGCCRTMRGFTENTPFELSLSSVFNAINSLLETTLSDKIQSVSEKRKEKKKNVFSPPDRQTVQENMKKYFSKRYGEVPEDFIETQTEMFFAYYEQIGWEIGKTKKKMKNVALACSGWVLRDKSFTEYKNSMNTVPALSVQPVSIEDIVREIYAIYEPMQFRQDWKNYRIENLIEEQARAFYAQMTKKNWKLNVGCQTWQDQLQVFAADMYCPLRFLNPDYVTKNKQEREARNELLTGFKNSDPFNRDSIENLKMILSR